MPTPRRSLSIPLIMPLMTSATFASSPMAVSSCSSPACSGAILEVLQVFFAFPGRFHLQSHLFVPPDMISGRMMLLDAPPLLVTDMAAGG